MARSAEGWKLSRDPRTGIYQVRFTRPDSRRVKRSTGTRDRAKAKAEAARIYAEHYGGHGDTDAPHVEQAGLEDLMAEWLVSLESSRDERTVEAYEMYATVHLIPFFGRLDRVTTAAVQDYTGARLGKVKRATVCKELSALRGFLKWAVQRGYMSPGAIPIANNPPVSATGRVAAEQVRVLLSPEEAEALIDAMPRTSRRGHFLLQPYYRVMWETALRRATLDAIERPGDYYPGRGTLRVRDEIDKARFGRELPLSQPAAAALDDACADVEEGLIFGAHDRRAALREAAEAVGVDVRVSNHDLRHSALTYWGEHSTSLMGMGYLAGHLHATTTAKYMHARQKAAQRVVDDRRFWSHTGHKDARPKSESETESEPGAEND